MNNMIKKIIETNKADLEKRKIDRPVEVLNDEISKLPKTFDFRKGFETFGIIAEIKLASPSAGEIANKDQVLGFAEDYKKGGVSAISIITEKYFFKGDTNFIKLVKSKINLPILQKDFVVDEYQIYEARVAGADSLLLIAKIIPYELLKEFTDLCLEVGVEPVVEINDEEDLEKALKTNTRIIAVNARDLDTFKVDIDKACELIKRIPDHYLRLGFSGVNSKEEVDKYKSNGASGVLIGTNLVKSQDKVKFLEELK